MSLLSQLTERLRKSTSITKESKLLLAVSGGVDSMVMLDLFQQLPVSLLPELVVGHIQHQLRTKDQHETNYLKQYCEMRQLPFFSKKWERAVHPVSGIEEAARNFRYQTFIEMMNDQKCTHLVLAHHGEDQMETILMKLTRGSSLTGIAAMKIERPFFDKQLVRPFLYFSKTALYDYADTHELTYFEDESNTSLEYTRNRYRLAMLPFLKEENTQAMVHFQQFSESLHDLLAIATPVIQEQLKKIQLSQKNCLSIEPFLNIPVYFHRPILGEWLQQQLAPKKIIFNQEQLQQIEALIKTGGPNQSIDLSNGYQVKRSYQYVELCEKVNSQLIYPEKISLDFGETIELPNGEKVTLTDTKHFQPKKAEKYIYLAKENLALPLTLRHRVPGDRMSLKGLAAGSKKIKDIFIDQKVPKEMREQAYLILDQEKKVICLLNYKESRLSIARETDRIQYILIISKTDEQYN